MFFFFGKDIENTTVVAQRKSIQNPRGGSKGTIFEFWIPFKWEKWNVKYGHRINREYGRR